MTTTEIVVACLGLAVGLSAAGYGIYVGISNYVSNRRWRKLYDSPEYQRRRRENERGQREARQMLSACQFCGAPKKYRDCNYDDVYLDGCMHIVCRVPVQYCYTCGAPYYPGLLLEPPYT